MLMSEIAIHSQCLLIKMISWLSLDAETGLLTGTPDDEQVGVYNITFSVEDAAGVASVSDAISLTVQNVQRPCLYS